MRCGYKKIYQTSNQILLHQQNYLTQPPTTLKVLQIETCN